ncbi:MAG: sterol desaturase family protein, partial [Planctomycetota bacterium]|nr:sterol desaturase family protein [Planctomycetota bacterium]
AHDFGLLRWIEIPTWIEWILALLLLDLFHYGFHVAAHQAPILWRFHAMHHNDVDVDVTSAMRFHTVEIAVQCVASLPILALCGVSMPQILLYELILWPSAMFHHANIRMPGGLDRVLRLIIVTPHMHWVHHSRWQPETNSNYSAVLSIWDRVFGTFRLRPDPRTIDFGLDGHDERHHATFRGLVATPFEDVPTEYGEPPPEEHLRWPTRAEKRRRRRAMQRLAGRPRERRGVSAFLARLFALGR